MLAVGLDSARRLRDTVRHESAEQWTEAQHDREVYHSNRLLSKNESWFGVGFQYDR